MTKTDLPRPTEGELEILKVLWERGPSTVRDVFEALHRLGLLDIRLCSNSCR